MHNSNGSERIQPARPRFRALSLALLLLVLVLAACGPKGTTTTPAGDDTGSLEITVQGLTGGASITVTGPGSYSQAVTGTTTLEDLVVGKYTVTAAAVAGHVVSGASSWTVDVEKGKTAQVTVAYAAGDASAFGTLNVTIVGLNGTQADVTVTGPGSFPATDVKNDITLPNLAPGSYTVTAEAVAGFVVSGSPAQSVEVTAGNTTSVTVTYLDATAGLGSLSFVVMGMAPGAEAEARLLVEGPDSYRQTVYGTAPLPNLRPGTYTVTAQAIADHLTVGTSETTVEVKSGETATATVSYMHAGLHISGTTTMTLPIQTSSNLTFTITRVGELSGDVDYSIAPIAGLSFLPATGIIAAGSDTFTVTVADDGAAVGVHDVVVSFDGMADGETVEVEHEIALTLELVTVVSDKTDDADSPEPHTLRALVEDARTAGSTISFNPDLFDGAGELEIVLDDQLAITHNLTIEGPSGWPAGNGPYVSLVGNNSFRIIMVNGDADVELANLQVSSGAEQDGAGIMVTEGSSLHLRGVHVHHNNAGRDGGGIWASSNLQISENSAVYLNNAARYGGGLFVSGANKDVTAYISESSRVNLNEAQRGAGVYLGTGTLSLDHATVSMNTATGLGGGIFADNHGFLFDRSYLNIVNGSAIVGNHAANGGGVVSYAMGRIEEALIEGNTASENGAGIRNHLYMTIDISEIIENIADGNYGGIFNDGLLTIRDSLVESNTAGGNGGGIYNGGVTGLLNTHQKRLTVERTEIVDNQAVNGGGIFSLRSLEVIDSQIHRNRAVGGDGAGVHAVTIPNPGVVNTFSITGSTMAHNVAGGRGGGIFVGTCGDAACLTPASAAVNTPFTMQNSTIAGNHARWGGGLSLAGDTTGQVRLAFNTIAYNEAKGSTNDGQGGGIHSNRNDVPGRPAVEFRGNIIGYNSSGMGGNSRDIYPGTTDKLKSLGYNLVTITPLADVQLVALTDIYPNHPAAGFAQIVPLSGLGDNGGYSETLAHVATGNVIFNYVPSTQCLDAANQPMTVDQRGEPRPVDSRCSVGAVQRQ